MALPEHIKKTIDGLRPQFPTEQALLIPALMEVQSQFDWVSVDHMRDVGELLNLPLSKVKEVASFYTMFKLKSQGKVDLQICTNISCWLNGADKLVACAMKRLHVGNNETTKDGNFTLSQVECLAACGTAPALMLNEDYYENVDESQLEALIDQAQRDLAAGKVVGKSTRTEGLWP
jgi:NADH-quinone oxidoreductase E subunit